MPKVKKDENPNNCKLSIDGDTLTIEIDLTQELGDSGTGKSVMVGKTEPRFAKLPDDYDDDFYVSVMVGKKIKNTKKDKK